MKKMATICSLAFLLVVGIAFNAAALPIISGDISFGGVATLDNTDLTQATQISFGTAYVTGVDGAYSSIPPLTLATFQDFIFDPPAASVIPLWTLTDDSTTYSLDATSMFISDETGNSITIKGIGLAHIDGYEDTIGTWVVTANSAGQTFGFSASTAVPEPLTLILLGSGLIGIIAIRRKL
jgi:hypothetical protein